MFRGTISLYDKLRVDKDPRMLLTRARDPKDAVIDRVIIYFIPRLLLIIFLQDVKGALVESSGPAVVTQARPGLQH